MRIEGERSYTPDEHGQHTQFTSQEGNRRRSAQSHRRRSRSLLRRQRQAGGDRSTPTPSGSRWTRSADLTTGSREEASYLLTQGNIRLLLTTGLHARQPAQREVMLLRGRRQGHRPHRRGRDGGLRDGGAERRRVGVRAARADRRAGHGRHGGHPDLRPRRAQLRQPRGRLRARHPEGRRALRPEVPRRSRTSRSTTTTASTRAG